MALSLDGTTGISASGNIVGNNISVSGSLTAGSFSPALLSTAGNVTGGNLLTGGLISATSSITSANGITATANVTGGNITTAGIMTSTGNAIHGNVLTAGLVSATGNVTANFFVGNGSALTGLSASKIYNGTSEANIGASGGNANITIGGTSNVAVFASTGVYVTGLTSASGNVSGGNLLTGGLISATSSITSANGITATANVTGGNITTAGLVSATGNVTGGNVLTGGYISATGIISSAGNITGANYLTGGLISATGNVTGGNLSVSTGTVTVGNIVNSNGNGVGNIGSSSLYYNTVFAKATSAQYADVAERYRSDADYPVGTVLMFGGNEEVTQSKTTHNTAIAGTVSENPAYIMNTGLESTHVATVALLGRVPCRVIGTIYKGSLLTSSEIPGVAIALDRSQYKPGCVIGKALENYNSEKEGIIEIVVGRL